MDLIKWFLLIISFLKKEDFLLARILIHIHILILVKMKRDLIFPWDVCIIGILSLIVEKLPITHLCLKFAYIVLLFVDDKGGEIYELMLWVPYLNLNYVKKACIEIYGKLIIEMLWLLNTLKYLHYVKISRTCIVILHVDILPYDELLPLLSFTFEM